MYVSITLFDYIRINVNNIKDKKIIFVTFSMTFSIFNYLLRIFKYFIGLSSILSQNEIQRRCLQQILAKAGRLWTDSSEKVPLNNIILDTVLLRIDSEGSSGLQSSIMRQKCNFLTPVLTPVDSSGTV
jgi:hypothetical protein